METLFIWDFGTIMLGWIVSLVLYFVFRSMKIDRDSGTGEFKNLKRIPDARLFGVLPAILVFFEVGLFCLLSMALYLGSVIIIESIVAKNKKKTAGVVLNDKQRKA